MFVKSTRFKQVCQLLLSLIVWNMYLCFLARFLTPLNFCAMTLLYGPNCLFINNNLWSFVLIFSIRRVTCTKCMSLLKVARYSFSGWIPPKFEHKLRCHKQCFGKIATTVVLREDENFLWSGLQRHRSCHSNEMTLLPILIAAVYLGTENCSSKIIHGSLFLQ